MPFLVGFATAVTLGVAACAPAAPPVRAETPAVAPRGSDGGLIVSVRPMTASDAILLALNEGAARGAHSGGAMEFIIRQDSGRTISVVQANADGFRPGERVALTGGARTRIAHLSG